MFPLRRPLREDLCTARSSRMTNKGDTMADTAVPADDAATKREQFKAQAQQMVENVKTELAQRLDQLLDELGALI